MPGGEIYYAVHVNEELAQTGIAAADQRKRLENVVRNISGRTDGDISLAEQATAISIAKAAGLPLSVINEAQKAVGEGYADTASFRSGYGAFAGGTEEIGAVLHIPGGHAHEEALKRKVAEAFGIDPGNIRSYTDEERANRNIPKGTAAIAIEAMDPISAQIGIEDVKKALEPSKEHGALDQIRNQMAGFSVGSGINVEGAGAAIGVAGKTKTAGASVNT